jgi:squalene-hopene/tetraprenyl-beta-curcumene cyclase
MSSNRLQSDHDAEASQRTPKHSTHVPSHKVRDAIGRTREFLLDRQHESGCWVGELEGDTILESEYVLLLAFLGRGQGPEAIRAARYIADQQLPAGGWAIYPGGPLEISASVKAYFALKITGADPEAEPMVRAREAIRAAGGAEGVNSFTRYYLALLGILSYDQCPAVPPEIMLIPRWMPFNIYEMSSWSRTIIVPLSLLWAFRPKTTLPPEHRIDELFLASPGALPLSMGESQTLDRLHGRHWINWTRFFRGVDRAVKFVEKLRLRPFRRWAIRRAERWMSERFTDSDGLGAIFPPIIWSVIALKCLGHDDESPDVVRALGELEKLTISEDGTDRLQPCKSPVWDTAIATIALRDSGLPSEHPALRSAVRWLLDREVREAGDWSVHNKDLEPGGWFFEFRNKFYPDVDDTAMVVMALHRCLPSDRWHAEVLLDDWSPHAADKDVSAVVSARLSTPESAYTDVEQMRPVLGAIRRGARWIIGMQNRDGGWGAFDRDNTREIFTRVPFADHNAMIDPSSSDLAARVVEMFTRLGVSTEHPAVASALRYVNATQESDGAWYGRWGVNYLYGTWQALVGLVSAGVEPNDPRIARGVAWFEAHQQDCGGWGETPESYDRPELRGQGPATASQTAWALLGLIAAGQARCESVRRGVEYLLRTQQSDGTWDEPWFTGTGFPKVFYLKYHLYSVYFPLMALGRYHAETP